MIPVLHHEAHLPTLLSMLPYLAAFGGALLARAIHAFAYRKDRK